MQPKVTNFSLDDPDIEDIAEQETIEVETPSGASVYLLSEHEAKFYQNIAARYQEHNKFTNISDLLELDRVLSMEVLCFRQSLWALKESDYDGRMIAKDLQKNIKDLSREIRDIKVGLGIDKKTRDAGQGETFAEKWKNLTIRAKEFGYHRNEQLIKAHTLWKELEAKITLYENSTPPERSQFNATLEDIVEWLKEKFEEFDDIDEAFKQSQKIWIREINE